ncbi:TolB-like protein [Novosphingobium aromaticivorans DSM 12444]|uniref:Tol-Pal system protein TolB 1 n=1 Tax=Novosphingobium aromaticivorans (strain ATCC 700278 / DSM 12444 / CCUG 56034 / CIP 105152 / NBRC 16084 / F199) TaxID=279238 RepID=TOLB1_NOVAD|nr:Tol-Pal system beta propeller repeat protein TolB [Novosphingobium aromaticivorans]Q2GBD2.1 RecName: Full=Tol-Pal system protein TolB 1; Flags: Precursor [Novosphingobium aromaticivorans DSM 12444]ABD24841.1 TolB-like protein [Novosphingobium aromaticivorans DSM 12444]SCY15956.1 TolB protein [Novosphingobium aromaticivorans]
MTLRMLFAFALLAAAPAQAQQTEPQPAEEGGLSGTVSDDSEWQDLGIAIPAFATNADVPTPTSAGSTSALGQALAQVISANLRNNGLFKPVGPESLPRPGFEQVQAPDFAVWSARSAEMLVQGYVRANGDGQLTVGCYLYDVALKQQLEKAGWTVAPADWRRAAHKCADMIYARLSGESPFFDSRVAYIAESGPKDRRMKRLAIMDSDGANHRYLTSGQATALTPRFSPDYKSILYLSYLNGRPRIYVYDLAANTQRLVTETPGPTFAPRWSPDGKWILYSMATAGNTDIYKVPASGGASQRLTDTPGIDVGGSFSPDGSRIVFESDRSGSQQIYVMNADGSDHRRISFFGGRAATPEWSPRGDQIAFTHIVGNLRIAVVSPGGGDLRYLTDSWQDEAPTWSPNGRIIQFFRTEKGSGKASVWQVDLTGRNERRLSTPGDASDPAWGPLLP